jgi:hypothetical protein
MAVIALASIPASASAASNTFRATSVSASTCPVDEGVSTSEGPTSPGGEWGRCQPDPGANSRSTALASKPSFLQGLKWTSTVQFTMLGRLEFVDSSATVQEAYFASEITGGQAVRQIP